MRQHMARTVRSLQQPWRNAAAARRLRREVLDSVAPIPDLTRYERRLCSQNGEDGILEAIFARIGTTNRFFVEFGVGNGRRCNTRKLVREGWRGIWIDVHPVIAPANVTFLNSRVTAENIQDLFGQAETPEQFDLLSIDIDGNDYWVWKAITEYRARVVVSEYNASVPPTEARAIAYDPEFRWNGTDYFGASLKALADLAASKGYVAVGCDSAGVNAFFVLKDLAAGRFAPSPIEALYRPPAYFDGRGHPPDPERRLTAV